MQKLPLDEKRAYIKSLLINGEVIVEFTKLDGEFRKMPCTLKPELLPVTPIVESEQPKKERAENPNVIRVFCTDKKEWRSFRIDSVTNIMEG
jgi:hypothetical protein